jgi:cytochrome c peroxidase
MTINMSHLIYENSNYATMRFEPEALHGANNGLQVARGVMEHIKKEFDWISYGDLWTLAGVVAIQVNDYAYFLGV